VADGKVVILGVQGVLSCYDATSGKRLWQNNDFENDVPMFHAASSPIVVDGLCIAQLGGEDNGAIVAFDLASGERRWDWQGDEPAYGSPVLMSVDGTRLIVAPTSRTLVALTVDGKLMWEMPYEQGGRYTSATPIVHGDTLIVAGPGTGISAFRLKRQGDKIVEEKLWSNADNSLQFNTPVLKGNLLVGLSTAGQLFCIDINNGQSTAWTAPIASPAAGAAGEAVGRGVQSVPTKRVRAKYVQATQQEDRQREERGRRRGFDGQRGRGEGREGFRGRGPGGRGGRGGRGGGSGHGSVIDAGSAFMALSPAGELVVFQPRGDAYSEVARYKVAEGTTNFRSEEGAYAYPVAVGEAIYIKDRDSLARWGLN
jgi:outer membrane protein assembly factor BamB